MTASTRFFGVAQPVPKSVFLDAYEETTLLAQLLVAPFGLPPGGAAADVLGGDAAVEEYTAVYRQWEDVLSRKVYAAKGTALSVCVSMLLFL